MSEKEKDRWLIGIATIYMVAIGAACVVTNTILWVPLITGVIICGGVAGVVSFYAWYRRDQIEAAIEVFRAEMDRTL